MDSFNGFYNFSLRSYSVNIAERCWYAHFNVHGDFPEDVLHNDTCIGDEPFVMLDIFFPVREDFIEKLKKESKKEKKEA